VLVCLLLAEIWEGNTPGFSSRFNQFMLLLMISLQGKESGIHNGMFNLLNVFKWRTTAQILHEGYDVFFAEMDIFLFKDPSPYLRPQLSLQVGVDGWCDRFAGPGVRSATSFRIVFCCALYVVQRHVTPFRVAPERAHTCHFILLCNLTLKGDTWFDKHKWGKAKRHAIGRSQTHLYSDTHTLLYTTQQGDTWFDQHKWGKSKKTGNWALTNAGAYMARADALGLTAKLFDGVVADILENHRNWDQSLFHGRLRAMKSTPLQWGALDPLRFPLAPSVRSAKTLLMFICVVRTRISLYQYATFHTLAA
jgi:hypothetical protein